MSETITSRFIESIWDFSKQDIPENINKEIKRCIIDYIACTNIGQFLLRNVTTKYADLFNNNNGNCSIIGTEKKSNIFTASLLNAFHCHYVELDDGSRYAMTHPGSPVISALIAVAQDRKMSAEDFLRGILVGYEATLRLAKAVQPGHKLSGFHATGTCATIGAALGIASALNIPKEQWNSIVSIASAEASGPLQMLDDQSELKQYNVGHASLEAVNSVYFSNTLLNGPTDSLGGQRGFFKTQCKEIHEQCLFTPFESYEILGIYRKPYASCRHAHSAIEAALNIRKELEINEIIESVKIKIYTLATKGHDHKELKGSGSARESIPYSVAAALYYGAADYEQYDEKHINNSNLQEILKKITIEDDSELSLHVPEKRPAVVEVKTNLKTHVNRVDYPLGEPENPLSDLQLINKYMSLMTSSGKSKEDSEKLLEIIDKIEERYDEFFLLI